MPGKASAREGYQRTGTLDGEPLTGVEAASDTEVGADRAGRLSAPDEGLRTDTTKKPVARDEGVDGGRANAEEAAVHIIEDEETAPGV
ncbi:DUF5709 domain-containing protein [Streptomyces sp. NPDC012825]|uniref:DUF5709 domain-containing protein n=1 Tax=Streptomyces sp. NPDC012825 TaxID=3364851 RepID=UPI003677777D